eukprot:4433256-Pyramimonas_sp.AAC.1
MLGVHKSVTNVLDICAPRVLYNTPIQRGEVAHAPVPDSCGSVAVSQGRYRGTRAPRLPFNQRGEVARAPVPDP